MSYSEKLDKILDLLHELVQRQASTEALIRKMKVDIDALQWTLESIQ